MPSMASMASMEGRHILAQRQWRYPATMREVMGSANATRRSQQDQAQQDQASTARAAACMCTKHA